VAAKRALDSVGMVRLPGDSPHEQRRGGLARQVNVDTVAVFIYLFIVGLPIRSN